MRILIILVAFAPIRLCSWNDGPNVDIWRDTWRGDTGSFFDVDVRITQPEANAELEPGRTELSASVALNQEWPQDYLATWFYDAIEVCEGWLDASSIATCSFELGSTDPPGWHTISVLVSSPGGRTVERQIQVHVGGDVDDDTQEQRDAALTLTSPPPSSVWTAGQPVPFVATLGTPAPIADARLVWEIDGLQIPALTVRTDSEGIAVSAAIFAPGGHEAIGTVFVDDVPRTVSTRFTVSEYVDTDSDSDPDTSAPLAP